MICKRVAELCKQRGVSIAKLERDVGLANGTISKWKKSSPTVDSIKKVAYYLGVSIDSIVSDPPTG